MSRNEVRMPYLRSDIPSTLFYSAYEREILRTARATSSKVILSSNSKKLIATM